MHRHQRASIPTRRRPDIGTFSLQEVVLIAIATSMLLVALGSLNTVFAGGAHHHPGIVKICHVTRQGEVTPIGIPERAVQRHMSHGDFRPIEFFADRDGDGLGDPSHSEKRCKAPRGFVENADDCDDSDAGVGGPVALFADTDGDGFGDPNASEQACAGIPGLVVDNTDCDDTDAAVNPAAEEIPGNGIDDDCNPDTPDEPQLTCPCEGQSIHGVVWSDEFNAEACFLTTNGYRVEAEQVEMYLTTWVHPVSGDDICTTYGYGGTSQPLTEAELTACNASLLQIAANDGVTCP